MISWFSERIVGSFVLKPSNKSINDEISSCMDSSASWSFSTLLLDVIASHCIFSSAACLSASLICQKVPLLSRKDGFKINNQKRDKPCADQKERWSYFVVSERQTRLLVESLRIFTQHPYGWWDINRQYLFKSVSSCSYRCQFYLVETQPSILAHKLLRGSAIGYEVHGQAQATQMLRSSLCCVLEYLVSSLW